MSVRDGIGQTPFSLNIILLQVVLNGLLATLTPDLLKILPTASEKPFYIRNDNLCSELPVTFICLFGWL